MVLGQTNDDTNIWYGFFNKTKLSNKISCWTETQLRYNLDTDRMGQTLVRTGLLAPVEGSEYNSEFGLLYAFIHTELQKEHRIAFQHSMSYGGFLKGFSHRIRYEFRSLEDLGGISDRFRYLVRYNGPKVFGGTKLVLWDEIFLNVDESASDDYDHLDRNRFFLGLRVPLENTNLEIGYLNQWIPRVSGDQMDHVITAYMFF